MIIFMESMRETVCKNFTRELKASEFAENIKKFSKTIRVNESTVHRWINGSSVPEVANLEEAAKAFGVDVTVFYKREPVYATISPRSALRKYLVIPDDIVEKLSHFPPESGVWESIRGAIDGAKKAEDHLKGL